MKAVDDSWLFKTSTFDEQHERRKKNFAKKASFGEPYDMAELRRALDDDREERIAKRKAAEEAKRREEEEAFRLTAPPVPAPKPEVKHEQQGPVEENWGPVCHCRNFRYPHFLEAHKQLASQSDWRTPEERERDEAEQRKSERSLRAGDSGRRQPPDRVRDPADRRAGKTGGQTG